MSLLRRFAGIALLGLGGLAAACGDDEPTGPGVGDGNETGRSVLSGTLSGVRTLSADSAYLLRGIVTVDSGSVLTIPAGTVIMGDYDTQPSALYVAVGGRIEALGTAAHPIVFTSSRPAGQRQPGDWAGVMINGRAQCNFTTQPCLSEGIQRPFGGEVNDDDSGTLAYVRIEYAGYEVSFGNEMNGLTLNGVGSGTDIHHIQVHRGLDDGIEWFGGAVDVKYAIVTGASDDSFDFSSGWIGRGQFWIVQSDPDDADRGFEVDNNETDNDALPRTDWQVYNVTLIGRGDGGTAGEAPVGITLRRGTAGVLRNAIVVGYEIGLDIDNSSTFAQCSSNALRISNSIFFDNGVQNDADADVENDCLDEASISNADPLLAAPYDLDAPDFRPAPAGSPVLTAVAPAPNDGFFEDVNYIGAVAPGETPWYAGWITTDWN